jgi:hypothetical protein
MQFNVDLSKIGCESDHIASISDLKPFQYDGCVKASGIGQHYFLWLFAFVQQHFWIYEGIDENSQIQAKISGKYKLIIFIWNFLDYDFLWNQIKNLFSVLWE